MPLINASSIIGGMIVSGTQNVTGSSFITVLMLMMVFVCFAALLKIPFTLVLPIVFIILFPAAIYMGEFRIALGMAIFAIAILVTQKFLFKS